MRLIQVRRQPLRRPAEALDLRTPLGRVLPF
jgi:hypothetical protein